MSDDIGMVKIEAHGKNIETKIKNWWKKKMVQIIEKADMEQFLEEELVFVVIPEKKTKLEKNEEQKLKKKSKLLKKYRKIIDINNVKGNLDTKMYSNRFVIRQY